MTPAEPGASPVRGPVFVGGTGRSGTTIMGDLIGNSQHYAVVPMEARFHTDGLPDLAEGRVSFEEFKQRMLGDWFRRPPNKRGPRGLHAITTRAELEELLERLKTDLNDDPWRAGGDLVRRIFDPVPARAGKEFWVEMTPQNTRRMKELALMLPDAKFINMVRDGRAVAHSIAHQSWGPNKFHDAMDWWSSGVIAAEYSRREVDAERVLTMRLESLTGESRDDAYARLASFLGVDEDAPMRRFFESEVSAEDEHASQWSSNLDEGEIAATQGLYDTHLKRLIDAGAGLPKPGLETVPGEIELPTVDAQERLIEPAAQPKDEVSDGRAGQHNLDERDAELALVRQGWQFVDTIERLGSKTARRHFRVMWDAERARAKDSFRPLVLGNLCGPNHQRVYEGESNLTRFRRTRDFVAAGERVFDIGLGRGYLPGIMLRDGELGAYHGIDPAGINVKATRQMLKLNGLADRGTVAVGDLYELTRDEVGEFDADLVVCCEVIEHVPDPEKAVQALADALPPGTELLISVPLLGELEVVWGHVNFFDMARARAMVENAGLTVHHVDAVDNIWTFILASNDPKPSPRAARAAAAPVDVTAHSDGTPGMPRGLQPIDLNHVGVQGSAWQKRLASSSVEVADDGVDFEGVAKGRSPRGTKRTPSSFAGITFPVHDIDGLRLELTVREAERVRAIYVDFYADNDRVGRWRWDNDRIPIVPGTKTHVLRPGRRSPTFKRQVARDLPSANSVDIFAQLEHGGSVKLRLNRLASIR